MCEFCIKKIIYKNPAQNICTEPICQSITSISLKVMWEPVYIFEGLKVDILCLQIFWFFLTCSECWGGGVGGGVEPIVMKGLNGKEIKHRGMKGLSGKKSVGYVLLLRCVLVCMIMLFCAICVKLKNTTRRHVMFSADLLLCSYPRRSVILCFLVVSVKFLVQLSLCFTLSGGRLIYAHFVMAL